MDNVDQLNNSGAQGPISNPVDRFAHLPKEVREWLESLRKDDIKEMAEAVQFFRSSKTIGRFGRWAVITIVGAFMTGAALWAQIKSLFKVTP